MFLGQRAWSWVKFSLESEENFGLESSEVLRILQAVVLLARRHPHEGNEVEVDASVENYQMNSSTEEMNTSKDGHC